MHNICTGECRGVSETPGVCTTEDCSKKEQSLEACDCADGNHNGRQGSDKKEESVDA